MSQAYSTKAVASSDAQAKRLAAIVKLCAALGTQYQSLRNYRNL